MTLNEIARKFVELCNQGKNFDVMETLYADGIVSVEGSGKETHGKAAVIQKSRDWAAKITIHSEKVLGPYYNHSAGSANQFAVHFTFDVTPKSTGKRVQQDEVALYTVENARIVREEFFYEENW